MKITEILNLYNLHSNPEQLKGHDESKTNIDFLWGIYDDAYWEFVHSADHYDGTVNVPKQIIKNVVDAQNALLAQKKEFKKKDPHGFQELLDRNRTYNFPGLLRGERDDY